MTKSKKTKSKKQKVFLSYQHKNIKNEEFKKLRNFLAHHFFVTNDPTTFKIGDNKYPKIETVYNNIIKKLDAADSVVFYLKNDNFSAGVAKELMLAKNLKKPIYVFHPESKAIKLGTYFSNFVEEKTNDPEGLVQLIQNK